MKKIIFVCGCARTGSTVLDLMLGNHPDGFSLGEVDCYYRPWRTHHFDIKCGCGVYPCPEWEVMRHGSERELYDRVFEHTGADFVVDSSKTLSWIVDQIRWNRGRPDREIQTIFVYKDPVALSYSHWKRGKEDLDYVVREYEYYERARAARISMATIAHKDIVRDAEGALARICGQFGLPVSEGRSAFWRTTHHHLFGSFVTRVQLHEDDPKIYREEFDPAFVADEERIRSQLESSSRVGETLAWLEEMQVDGRRREVPDHADVRRTKDYMRERMIRARFRLRPQIHPDRESSMIREWNV